MFLSYELFSIFVNVSLKEMIFLYTGRSLALQRELVTSDLATFLEVKSLT